MRKQLGFTLTELMITVAIMAILLAIAVPSFQQTIANNRVRTAADGYAAMLQLARVEAVKRGASVSVCTACGEQTGFVVFVDAAAETDTTPDVQEVLRVAELPPADVARSDDPLVRFGSSGMRVFPAGDVEVEFSADAGRARNVVVTVAGHVAVEDAQ